MRTRLITLTLATITALGLGSSAFAQDDPAEEWVKLTGMTIDGEPLGSNGSINTARGAAIFDRNAKLKKSFLHETQDSTLNQALIQR